jgi:hypothetical protein
VQDKIVVESGRHGFSGGQGERVIVRGVEVGTGLAKCVQAIAQKCATQVQHALSAFLGPKHPGTFHSLADDRFAAMKMASY